MILRLLFLVLSKLRVAEIGIELITVLTGFLLSGCVVSKDFLSSCDSKITEYVMELVQESWKGRYDLENFIVFVTEENDGQVVWRMTFQADWKLF